MMRQHYGIDDLHLRKAQAAFLFAQKIGLLEDPSLEGLECRRQQHNAKLRKMEVEGQVFYGPRYFSPAAYLQYELTRLKLDFVEPCAAVRRSGLCPDFTDEEKRAFYEANLDLFGRYHGDHFSYEEVAQIIEKRLREQAYEQIIEELLPDCEDLICEFETEETIEDERRNRSSSSANACDRAKADSDSDRAVEAAESCMMNISKSYYVSARTGDDANDGLRPERAFASLFAVNQITLRPGDQVLLECGSVFHGQFLQITDSGTKAAPIVIRAYGEADAPRIDAAGQGIWYQDYGNPLDSPTHVYRGYVSSAVLLYDSEYVTVEDLEITNRAERILGEHYSQCDKMNRSGVAIIAKDRGIRHGITLRHLSIHDVEGNVYDKHMNNGGIYATALRPTDEEATGVPRYQDMTIEGCFVYRVSRWGIGVGYTYAHAAFQGAELTEATFRTYGHERLVIRDNYVKEAGGDGITAMYALRPLIEHNMADSVACEINDRIYSEPGNKMGKVAAGIWPWKCKDALFRYNEVVDTRLNQDGMAYDADSGDGTVYEYNYSRQNEGGCVMFCLQEAIHNRFRHNVSYDDLGGTISPSENPDALLEENVFYVRKGVPFIRKNMGGGTYTEVNNRIIKIEE